MKQSSWRAKNLPDRTMTKSSAVGQYFGRSGGQGTSASAGGPIDFVSAAGTVRVPQDLISELMFTRIDFWS